MAAASEKLGIGVKTLYAWQRAQRLERGEAPEGLRHRESAEQGFKRLEREIESCATPTKYLKSNRFYDGPITQRKPREIYAWNKRKLAA